MIEKIHLLHTNDLHSHFENWPRMRRFIIDKQELIARNKEEYITVDLGDFMDRFHPLTDVTNGIANVEIMNQVTYDYATIGNNEGMTNSKNELNHLYDNGNFSLLLANLYDKDTMSIPEWAKAYDIFKTNQGTRIGFIGLTVPLDEAYNPFGWHVMNPIESLEKLLPEVKKNSDIIVLLSHLGLPDDKKIAEHFKEIDVILESHTHHLLKDGLVWEETLLASAGRFGEYIGEVELEIHNHHLIEKKAVTTEIAVLEERTQDLVEIANYKLEGENLLKEQQLGELPETLIKETSLMAIALDAVKEYAGVDVALLNTGLIITNLDKGLVTKKDLHECLPHPMNIIKVTLKGSDVKRLVYEIEKNRAFLNRFHVIGMKFRGKYFGQMCYDGLAYSKETKEVTWCNQVIDDEKDYTLATVDYLSFLPFFPTLEIAGKIEIVSSDFLRTIVGEYIKVSLEK